MITGKTRNNKGMSLVEIIVVLAILAVVAGGIVVGVGIISSGNEKKAAESIQTGLSMVRTNTLTIQSQWEARIVNDGGSYAVIIYRDGEEYETTDIGSRVDIEYTNNASANGAVDENKELIITFRPSTGVVEDIVYGDIDGTKNSLMDASSLSFSITVTGSGGGSSINIWYDTGKITT